MSKIMVLRGTSGSCGCEHCANYSIEKFAELMGCGCACHLSGYIGHDSLCCSLPNVLPENHIKPIEKLAPKDNLTKEK